MVNWMGKAKKVQGVKREMEPDSVPPCAAPEWGQVAKKEIPAPESQHLQDGTMPTVGKGTPPLRLPDRDYGSHCTVRRGDSRG